MFFLIFLDKYVQLHFHVCKVLNGLEIKNLHKRPCNVTCVNFHIKQFRSIEVRW